MTDATRTAQENVQRARADLGETIDALKQKLSVGELVGEVQAHFGGTQAMSNMMNNLSRQAQGNPMALALIGAGMAWLMMSDGSRNGATHGGRFSSGMRTTSNSMAGHGASSSPYSMSDLSQATASATASVRESASAAGDSLASGAAAVSDATSRAMGAIGEATTSAPHQLQQMSEDLVDKHPIAVGAIALALGAAIGASLPRTAVEDEQLGQASDRVKDAISEQGEKVMHRAEEVASSVTEAAAREADKQGLVPDAGEDTSTVAERLEKVGREAARAAREGLDSKDDGATDRTDQPSPPPRAV